MQGKARNVVGLFLTLKENDYQQALLQGAQAAARKAGLELIHHFAQNQFTQQTNQVFELLRARGDSLAAIVAMPVSDEGLCGPVKAVTSRNIGVVILNRRVLYMSDLRRTYPELLLATVAIQQEEIGVVHARQTMAMLPQGGFVLYVRGGQAFSSTKDRERGFIKTLEAAGKLYSNPTCVRPPTDPTIQVTILDGDFTQAGGAKALADWLKFGADRQEKVHLIVGQNDAMVAGILAVLEQNRPANFAETGLIGCDGTPDVGRKMVDQGQLQATIELPITSTHAIHLISNSLQNNQLPKEPAQFLPIKPYPALS